MRKIIIILCCIISFCSLALPVHGQGDIRNAYWSVIESGDTVMIIPLPMVYIFPPYKFKNAKEENQYWKLVRDVKKTLPYAKLVYATLIETYQYIETLPNDKAKEAHLKRMEKELFKEYKPVLKKMSYSQGKLLIKLINRECNQSSFHLIKAFLGGFRAGLWQTFGSVFGVSLKTDWDPTDKDALIERICLLVESGAL